MRLDQCRQLEAIGQSRLQRAFVAMILIAAQALIFQTSVAFAETPGIQIRRVFVPEKHPERWPEGDWVPIQPRRLDELLKSGETTSNAPERFSFASSVYKATFNPLTRRLEDGTATLDYISHGDAGLILFEPCSLTVSDPQWSETDSNTDFSRRAVLGTDLTGLKRLVTPNDSRSLMCQWSLPGRQRLTGLDFDIEVPQAVVTAFELTVPAGWQVSSNVGVTRLATADQTNGEETHTETVVWKIELGQSNRCRVRLQEPGTANAEQHTEIAAYRLNSRSLLRSEWLEQFFEFTFETLPAGSDELTVSIPPELIVSSIDDGSGGSFSWRDVGPQPDKWHLLRIQISESESLRVVIQGSQPVPQADSEQHRLRLAVPRPADAVLLSGNVSAVVESPYQIATYSSNGLRQTSTSVDEDRHELSFHQYSSRASVDLQVQNVDWKSASKLAVREYSQLDLRETPQQLNAVLELTAQSQSAFTSSWLVPLEWELTSVRIASESAAGSTDGEELVWSVSREAGKHQVLVIDLADGLPVRKPLQLLVTAQRADLSHETEFQVPVILPETARSVSVVFGVVGCEEPHQTQIVSGAYRRHPDSESLMDLNHGNLISVLKDKPEAVWTTDYWALTEEVREAMLLLPDSVLSSGEADNPDVGVVVEDSASNREGDGPTPVSQRPGSAVHAADELALEIDDAQGSRHLSKGARLAQPAIVSAGFESQLSPGTVSQDLHRFTWKFHYSSDSSPFRFRLPLKAELLAVTWRGQKVAPVQEGQDWFVPLVVVSAGDELIVDYTLPSQDVYLRETYRCRVPMADVTVIGFDWKVRLRSRYSVVSFSVEMAPEDVKRPGAWLSWFFGPLARNSSSSIFNPLRGDAWLRLLSGGGDEDFSQDRGNSTDWKVFSASATELPDSLTVHICDHSRLHALAWFVLTLSSLIGVLLRAVAAPHRSQFALIWLSGCVASVALVPDAYGELIGAAALGSIFATLVPRSLVRPIEKNQLESAKAGMASTITRRIVTGSIALSALAFAASAWAQQAESESGKVIDVLIRYLDSPFKDEEEHEYVFIRSSDLRNLYESSIRATESLPPSLLIESHWDVNIAESDRAEIVASLVVALHDKDASELQIPIPARFLTGQSVCTINDIPVSVLPTADGSRLRIPVPKELDLIEQAEGAKRPSPPPLPEPVDLWREYTIKLHLRPLTNRSTLLSSISLPVPEIMDSRLSLSFHRNPVSVTVGELSESISIAKDGVTERPLGPVGELKVSWRPTEAAERRIVMDSSMQPGLEIRSSIEIHPNWMERRTLARYLVDDQPIRTIEWKLPGHCQVNLDQFRFRNLVDKAIRRVGKDMVLVCEVDPPMTEAFDFEFQWQQLQPDEDQADAITWAIPVVPGDINVPLTIKSHLAGLYPEAGFQPSQELQNQAMASDVEADEFVALWPENNRPKTPQMAFRVSEGTVLVPGITPLQTQRTTRLSQEARIRLFGVRWTVTAEVDTAVVPAFTHEFLLDDTFRVDAVTVLEDDVDRLSHWEHQNGRLFLHLRDRRSGVQNITITGQQQLNPDGEITVPRIESVVGVNAEPVLLIYRSPQLQVLVDGAEAINEESTVASETSGTDEFVGRFRLSAGQRTSLMVEQVPVEPSAWTFARVAVDETDTVHIAATVHLHAMSGKKVQIDLPNWAAQGVLTLEPTVAGAAVRTEVLQDQKLIEVTFPRPVPRQVRVAMSVALSSSETSSFRLPALTVRDIEQQHAAVVFGKGMQEWELQLSEPLSETLLAEMVEIEPGLTSESGEFYVWTNTTRVSQSSDVSEVENLPPFVMHLLRPGIRRNGVSTSRILMHTDRPHLSLEWPQNAQLISVRIDGQVENILPPVDGLLRLPFTGNNTVHDIEVLWRKRQSPATMKIQRRSIPVPQLRDTGSAHVYVVAIPSRRANLIATEALNDSALQDAVELSNLWITQLRKSHLSSSRLDTARRIEESLLNAAGSIAGFEDSLSNGGESELTGAFVRDSVKKSLLAMTGDGWGPNATTVVQRVDNPSIGLWVVDNRINRVLGSILIAIAVLPFFVLLLGFETGDRIARRPELCWLFLGLIWWLCLKGSGAGFVLGGITVLWIACSHVMAIRLKSSMASNP